jgi:hypothetical protein
MKSMIVNLSCGDMNVLNLSQKCIQLMSSKGSLTDLVNNEFYSLQEQTITKKDRFRFGIEDEYRSKYSIMMVDLLSQNFYMNEKQFLSHFEN